MLRNVRSSNGSVSVVYFCVPCVFLFLPGVYFGLLRLSKLVFLRRRVCSILHQAITSPLGNESSSALPEDTLCGGRLF